MIIVVKNSKKITKLKSENLIKFKKSNKNNIMKAKPNFLKLVIKKTFSQI